MVGSGPGGLQAAYSLRALGVNVAAISQDDAPGGMFRSLPIFGRLLSWSKPDAPAERGSREYEWYDHNSLLADEPEARALVPLEMDRTWAVPSRPEMERGLAAFAERTGLPIRYGCRWESTRREDDGSLTLTTTDGEYRCRAAVFALGVTDPWKSDIAGTEDVPHYVDTEEPRAYAGKRVVVIGKRNSGFEIADGLLPWASQVLLVSPRPVQTSVLALASVRVRYMQPLEDYGLGGGTFALDAAIERVERTADGFRDPRDRDDSSVRPRARGGRGHRGDRVLHAAPRPPVARRADGRAGADTGADAVLGGDRRARDLLRRERDAGLRRPAQARRRRQLAGRARVPLQRPRAGGAPRWIGVRPAGGAARRGRRRRVPRPRARARPGALDAEGLPRVRGRAGRRRRGRAGIQPLAHFVDADEPDALAATIETNAAGEIYPVVYVRRGGRIEERVLDPDPLHAYDGPGYRAELEALAADAGK